MEVAAVVDDMGRPSDLEARVSELERRQQGGGSARRESIETAFWALMREVFPAQTRTHMKAAGREQLLAARSYLDHWIAKLDEQSKAAPPAEREEITVE
jgi:BMFP domain-containing protein YqiC